MVQTENYETGFIDYSSDTESLYLLRRGKLRILISIEKNRENIPASGDKDYPVSPYEGLISMMKILKGEPNAKI
ncbi:MAG: hypothetical protein PHU34_02710 [Candidatus Methanoperedens sp.]|nr:hypothetical protein [Candidatus Methanoperedens sp.]